MHETFFTPRKVINSGKVNEGPAWKILGPGNLPGGGHM